MSSEFKKLEADLMSAEMSLVATAARDENSALLLSPIEISNLLAQLRGPMSLSVAKFVSKASEFDEVQAVIMM
jgi:hypothetical protein